MDNTIKNIGELKHFVDTIQRIHGDNMPIEFVESFWNEQIIDEADKTDYKHYEIIKNESGANFKKDTMRFWIKPLPSEIIEIGDYQNLIQEQNKALEVLK